MRKQYEFAQGEKSVLIHTAVPPRLWFNDLWNDEGYLASFSQQGIGEIRYLTPTL